MTRIWSWSAGPRRATCEAFGELVERNRRAVFRAALAAVGSATEADDVAQEAFVTAFQKLKGFRGESSFKTWLLTITWRKAIDRRQERDAVDAAAGRAGAVRARPARSGTRCRRLPAGGQSQEDDLLTSDLQKRLRPLIASLPKKLRDALLLAGLGRPQLRRDRTDAEDSDRHGEVAGVGSAQGAETEDGGDGI